MDIPSIIIQFAVTYSFVTNYLTITLGLIGNALNLLIFTQLKLFQNNRFTFYLIIESISNFLNEISTLISTIAISIYGDNIIGYSLPWCRLRYLISQTLTLLTFSMICCSACDQFCSTIYRWNLTPIFTHRLARYLILICLLFCLFHSLLFSFFVGIHSSFGCTILNSIWIQYSTYFFYPVLGGLLPISLASIFSLFAFVNVRRIVRRQIPIERRRFDRQITAMILMRVVVFVVCTLPYTIYRIYAINIQINPMDRLRIAMERLFQVSFVTLVNLNYAISFYMFLFISVRYRRQVKHVLMKKCWRRMKHCCYRIENEVHPENTRYADENIDPQ